MNKPLNKKGQSLIMFIIFLPIILMSLALIIDVGLMYNAKMKGDNLLKDALKDNLDIEDYFKINDIDITSIKNTRKNSKSCVIIKYKIDSIFGSIIGYNDYEITINNCE